MNKRMGWLMGMLAMVGTVAVAGNFAKQPTGAPGGWAGTIAGAVLDGTIYTVDSAGSLQAADPADDSSNKIGGADFANTAFLFAAGNSLVSIEKNGTLNLIDPATGAWKQSGPAGGWANTIAGTMLDDTLYTVESAGALYASDPAAGTWRKVGNSDFAATKFLFAAGGQLASIENSGTLYLIDPADGSWKRSGDAGAWANTVAGAPMGPVLFTVESDGALVATDVASGTRVPSGAGFHDAQFLFLANNLLCGIDAKGNFFQAASVEASAVAAAPAAATTAPAPSSEEDEAQNDPARAGALTFQFMGQWVGDTAPLEQDPEFLKQKEAAPEMVQQVLDLMRDMKMSVTLDGVAMEVMGEKVGPFGYSVVAGHDDILVIENDEGPKAGIRARIVFSDPKHLQVIELTPAGKAMFFKKP